MRRSLAMIALISLFAGWLLTAPAYPPAQIVHVAPMAAENRSSAESQVQTCNLVLDTEVERGLEALPNLTDLPKEQRKYLLSLQDASGAIAQTPAQRQTVPYFANMAALAMLSYRDGRAAVRQYLDWYVAHLNSRDRHGLSGTIYDHVRVDEQWVSTDDYDSADSYAATFLSLVLAYTDASQDERFLRQHADQLTRIAGVLLRLQDTDGLMWAKPGYYVKFLMDNAENYRGLLDAAELMRRLGREDQTRAYELAATKVAVGIERRLWLPKREAYAWALYGRWWARQPVDRWYPDTIAQVYPIIFGLVAPDGPRAQALYAYLNSSYPNWVAGDFDDRYPWTILALVAATMQDKARAMAYLNNVNQQEFLPSQGAAYPWYAGESAFLVQAWQLLRPHVPAWKAVDPDDDGSAAPLGADQSQPDTSGESESMPVQGKK